MEKIQERSLRFIYDDHESSYEQLLQRSGLPTLEIRRLRNMAIECFKIIHDLSLPCLSDLVSLRDPAYSFRYTNILEIPIVRTDTFFKIPSGLQLLFFGMNSRNISELKLIFCSSKV